MLARIVILVSAFVLGVSGANLTLTQNGKSDYTIVIGAEASPSERHAAQELQSFLEQISGARLPISTEMRPKMVLVGDSAVLQALHL